MNGGKRGRLGPGGGGGGGGNNLGDLMPGGGGRILGISPGCRTGNIPRGRIMSGGGGARRPINGGGFIIPPRPFPRSPIILPLPRASTITYNTKNQLKPYLNKMAELTSLRYCVRLLQERSKRLKAIEA